MFVDQCIDHSLLFSLHLLLLQLQISNALLLALFENMTCHVAALMIVHENKSLTYSLNISTYNTVLLFWCWLNKRILILKNTLQSVGPQELYM